MDPGLPGHALNLSKSHRAVKGYETLLKPFISMSLRGEKKPIPGLGMGFLEVSL
jgi:hypothetical protein